jgi:hypothetical protein
MLIIGIDEYISQDLLSVGRITIHTGKRNEYNRAFDHQGDVQRLANSRFF